MAIGRDDHKDAGKKKKARGSTRNKSRLDAFADRGGGGDASWGDCDCSWLQAAVVAITSLGGAVTFGLSRDLGAHSMTLMLDGDRTTMWFNGAANLDDELKTVIGTLDDMAQ